MSEDRPEIVVGQVWKRSAGKERVKIGRYWMALDGLTVRAHPVTGGRVLIADVRWFRDHYTLETPRTVDLMAALEASVNAAKEARKRHPTST